MLFRLDAVYMRCMLTHKIASSHRAHAMTGRAAGALHKAHYTRLAPFFLKANREHSSLKCIKITFADLDIDSNSLEPPDPS